MSNYHFHLSPGLQLLCLLYSYLPIDHLLSPIYCLLIWACYWLMLDLCLPNYTFTCINPIFLFNIMCYLLFIFHGEMTSFQKKLLQYMNECSVNLLCWNAYKFFVCNICVHVAHFILHILISFQFGEFFFSHTFDCVSIYICIHFLLPFGENSDYLHVMCI